MGTNLTAGARLAPYTWFRTGGAAEWLATPATIAELAALLSGLPEHTPVLPLGLGSNLIVRDGGVPGVTVRLGKAFAGMAVHGEHLRAGAGAPGITVAAAARDAGLAGLEFLRGIPGTVGGALRGNAGAYGRDMADLVVEATVVTRCGAVEVWPAARFAFAYRHSALPPGHIVVDALLCGTPGDRTAITAEMDRIAAEREASQPLRTRTGGSTFRNPPGHKAWALIDAAGCRGVRLGGAQVSEKHCNFLINTGGATSADIEALGEQVRAQVFAHSGIMLDWEIERVGEFLPSIADGGVAGRAGRGGDTPDGNTLPSGSAGHLPMPGHGEDREILPGTGRGTAAGGGGGERERAALPRPLHQASPGPPPRAGEDA